VLSLAERVSFQVESVAADPTATAGTLEIVMSDGCVLSKRVTHPRGHYSMPLSWQELCAKFQMCAAEARVPLSSTQSARLLQWIQELEQQRDATAALAGILGG
jgi:2-methylcitrate dehydratase PrpD